MSSKIRADSIAPFSASIFTISSSVTASAYYGDGSNLSGVGIGSGYPFDMRPNSTVIKLASNDTTTTSITADTATSSLYLAGTLYSPSNTVQIVSSSTYATASIVAQSYVNNTRFNFTLSSSLGAYTGSNEAIQLAVQSAGFPDDGPQTLGFIASAMAVPLTIPSCSLWLDADDASSMTVASGTVSEWRNKSVDDTGLFDHAQSNASYQPAYIAGAINSRTVVRFDGSNDELRGFGSISRRSPAGSDQTVTTFLVASTISTAGADTLLQWGLNSGYINSSTHTTWVIQNWRSGGRYMVFTDANGNYDVYTDAAGALTTTARIFTVTQTTSSQTYHVTGMLNAATTTPWANVYPSDNGHIYSMIGDDAYGSGARSFEGDIAEIIVYSRDLSTSEREQVETYLADKWGITLP